MKIARFISVLLLMGIINLFTLGFYKSPITNEMSLEPIEMFDPLGLEELKLKLDSVNLNLDSLQHEKGNYSSFTGNTN